MGGDADRVRQRLQKAIWTLLGVAEAVVIACGVLLACSAAVSACGPEERDIMAEMLDCVAAGDTETGAQLAAQRAEKITTLGLDEVQVAWEDLWWLARIIEAEAGNTGPELRRDVGAVVLNRVADWRFADSVYGVIFEPGQYAPAIDGSIWGVIPSADSAQAALDCLAGAWVLPPDVVWQSNRWQGTYCYRSYWYFGRTSFINGG